ncbi:FAD binding domain-containing protein [Aspergillus cavernicola]|uniref:FAD binding domain-containing protein n=1 Tax=Aspergillus cavernicola TaxID=176166 RepID=A0ABR4J7D0_9EURO
MPPPTQAPILIIGAGPVGLCLALELLYHSVPVVIIEKTSTITNNHPKGRNNDMRTLEHYRRWGVSDEIRSLSWKTENPKQELIIKERLVDQDPIGAFPLKYGRDPDESGQFVAEPSLSAPQPVLQGVLERRVVELGGAVWRGWEVTNVDDRGGKVIVTARRDDEVHEMQAEYVVGCDGPGSLVRKAMGVEHDGEGPLGRTWTYVVRSEGFPIASALKGSQYDALGFLMVVNPEASSLINIPGEDEWGFGILVTGEKKDTEPAEEGVKAYARRLLGAPAKVDIISRSSYAAMMRLSRKYRRGRLFIAGDACHICPPTGGHNMNTGIEDAVNLGWKLAGVLQGWGRDALLDTYHTERWPVGRRVSGVAMANSLAMSEAEEPVDGAGGAEPTPADRARQIFERTYRQWNSYGVVLDQRYDGSPAIIQEGWEAPPWTPTNYWPHARPGHRAPHLWLPDRTPLHDHFGKQFTLLNVGASKDIVDRFLSAATSLGLSVVELQIVPQIAGTKYPAKLTLIRPDQYISWQGDECDAEKVIRQITGHITERAATKL